MTTNIPSTTLPSELRTSRLLLRSADPNSEHDCISLWKIYLDANATNSDPISTPTAEKATRQIQHKHRVNGAQNKPELCTLVSPPPEGIYWLVYLPTVSGQPLAEPTDDPDDIQLVGFIGLSFRPELPYPDLGYAILSPHRGKSYASEAGKEVLRYWTDVVGVREVFCGCPVDNLQSRNCAQKIGFVEGGPMHFEVKGEMIEALAYVLPGMSWEEGRVARPADGFPPAPDPELEDEVAR